jgi:hypothetical protein
MAKYSSLHEHIYYVPQYSNPDCKNGWEDELKTFASIDECKAFIAFQRKNNSRIYGACKMRILKLSVISEVIEGEN